jgi:hypothetical protein
MFKKLYSTNTTNLTLDAPRKDYKSKPPRNDSNEPSKNTNQNTIKKSS